MSHLYKRYTKNNNAPGGFMERNERSFPNMEKKKAVAKKMSTKTTFEHLKDLVKEGKIK